MSAAGLCLWHSSRLLSGVLGFLSSAGVCSGSVRVGSVVFRGVRAGDLLGVALFVLAEGVGGVHVARVVNVHGVGVDPAHVFVRELFVHEAVDRVLRRDAFLTFIEPGGRFCRREAIVDEEHEEDPEEDLFRLQVDLVEQLVEAGVDELCPEASEDAPEQGIEEADPAADVERHLGVVPGDVAEDEFHAEGHDVLGEGQDHEGL